MKARILFLAVTCALIAACGSNDNSSKADVEIMGNPENPDGFTVLEDGRKIRLEREGKGELIDTNKLLILHYKEWLLPNRRKINDTYEMRKPAVVRLRNGQLTKGLERTILEHRIGSVFQLEVPWELAYGDTVYLDYPPKRDVVYDVSLLGLKNAVPLFNTTGISPELTMSGLEIYRVSPGKGEPVQKGNRVEVFYHGYFTDGTFFDSSYDREAPIAFEVGTGQVIPGWDEVIQRMKPGEKVHVKIPFYLAYGESGRGAIPPKTDLCFDMELVSVTR